MNELAKSAASASTANSQRKLALPPELEVTRMSHDSRGIAHHQGKTIFVSQGLPGETVSFQVLKRHARYDEVKATAVLANPSEHRVTARCPHFSRCGGCQLQHFDYARQLQYKQQVLLEQVDNIGHTQPQELSAAIVGPEWNYRHKARLGVYYHAKQSQLKVGFREQHGRFIVNLDVCKILAKPIADCLPALRDTIAQLSIYDQIAQVEVAVADNACTLIFRHLQALNAADQQCLTHFGAEHNIEIYLQPAGPASVHKIYPHNSDLLFYDLPEQQLRMHFHPQDFTQINPNINRQMIQRALQWLAPTKHENVLDLFCGLGNFSLPLAQQAQHVLAIEASAEMVLRGQSNAKFNNLHNINFRAADLYQDQPLSIDLSPYQKALIDPPRSGAEQVVRQLCTSTIAALVYVSCNPSTMARDAKILRQGGFRLQRLSLVDMFPHTQHIEAIGLFSR